VDPGCVMVYLWWQICCVMVDLRGGGDEVVIESMENVPSVFFHCCFHGSFWGCGMVVDNLGTDSSSERYADGSLLSGDGGCF